MGHKILIPVILFCTLGISFIIATALFDVFANGNGFYEEGIEVSRTWEE